MSDGERKKAFSVSDLWVFTLRAACLMLLVVPWSLDGQRIVRQGVETAMTPVPTCLTELHILDGMQRVAQRETLYPPMDGLPYTYHLYSPLTYVPTGLAGRLLQLDFDGLLVASRLPALLAAMGIIAVLCHYTWRTTRDWIFVLMCAAMVLFYHSSALTDFFRNRPETPALLLSLAGWLVVQCRPRSWTILAAILFVGAVGFKQTYLAAPIACGLQLWMLGDRRDLLRLTATCIGLGAAMVGASYMWLGVGYFDHTVWAMQSNPLDPVAGAKFFYPVLVQGHWGMLLPAALVAVISLAVMRREGGLLLYLLVCFLLTSILHGKVGADLNYHGELTLLMILTVVVAIGRLAEARSIMAWCPVVLLLLGTWMPALAFGYGWNTLSHSRIERVPHAYQGPPQTHAARYVSRYAPFRGQALILDDEIALRLGDPVVYDWYALRLLFDAGHLDFGRLRDEIESRHYAVIVLPNIQWDEWTQQVHDAAQRVGYQVALRDEHVVELVLPQDSR